MQVGLYGGTQMKTSENVEQIFKAYTECTPKLLNIAKDSKAYNYNYTSLEKLIEHTKPILAEHGLAILQMTTGDGVISRLIHNSGEWIEQEMKSEVIQMKQMNAFQVQGNLATYMRRYSWSTLCGIASDDDIDAAGEQVQPQQMATREQVLQIQELITGTATDQHTFLEYFKVKSIKDLSAQNASNAIATLNKKKASL